MDKKFNYTPQFSNRAYNLYKQAFNNGYGYKDFSVIYKMLK